MPLEAGTCLGPYEIIELIGAGGMGEVYRARDTRLNRTVAVKVSRERFNERFTREAKVVATLNHPYICTLYDVGPDYLVMEYVDGEPLTGPLPLAEAIETGKQIAEALDHAHRHGVTHRDLKPANILATNGGLKLLDFGLAKIQAPRGAVDETRTMSLTQQGAIIGTLQYMSPEQLEGKEADSRSDIFAFGLVLYELIAGKRAFTGTGQANLMASILKEQPQPLHELQPQTPRGLERVLETCLEKDPDKRWQSAGELKHALDWNTQAVASLEVPAKKLRLWQGLAALLGLSTLGVAAWALWPKTEPAPAIVRFEIPLPQKVTIGQYVSLSPDGHKLVFDGVSADGSGLWIRDLDTLDWRRLPGAEGGSSPFWSPDSKSLGFASGNQVKKVDLAGGPAQTICTVTVRPGTGAWSRDGIIIFGSRGTGPLWKVSQAGGVAAPLTVLNTSRGETIHVLPTFLPDGKHFLYLRQGPAEVSGIYPGSVDSKPEEQSGARILATRLGVSYVSGYVFFMRERMLTAQPFDTSRMQLTGESIPVAEPVGVTGAIGIFSASASGALAYRSASISGTGQLTWLDRQGKTLNTVGQGLDGGIALSPDGTRGAVRDALEFVAGDLWTLDLTGGARTRLTFRQRSGSNPVWSPNGTRIAFSTATESTMDTLLEKASSGAGEEKELLREPGKVHQPTDWSRDGRFLLYTLAEQNSFDDLWILPVQEAGAEARKPVLLLGGPGSQNQARFSPDMRWIAYSSDESGRTEVYVRPFQAVGSAGKPSVGEGRWQISREGGSAPRWRADGKEIFFAAPPNGTTKMAAEVKTNGDAFELSVPQRLFAAPPDAGWDVSADGKRFLLAIPQAQPNVQAPVTMVLNWPTQFKK